MRSQLGGDGLGRDLGPGTVEQHQLRAAGEESGRARFVDLDMRVPVADDAAIRRAQRGEREAVGGGARRDPEGADLVSNRSEKAASRRSLQASPS